MDRAALSDSRRGSSEGNTKAALCFVLPACPVFFLPNHLLLYGNMSLPGEFTHRHHLYYTKMSPPPSSDSRLLMVLSSVSLVVWTIIY